MDQTDQPKPQPLQLALTKKDQQWIFRYMPGEESAILRGLANTASDSRHDFDWFDAAVLSHQMGDKIHKQLKILMPKTHATQE